MKPEKLKQVLAEHLKWVRGEGGARASLASANLSSADLSFAVLSLADLRLAEGGFVNNQHEGERTWNDR